MAEGALERILAAPLQRLVTSDSIPPPDHPQLETISGAPLLAKAIRRVIGKNT